MHGWSLPYDELLAAAARAGLLPSQFWALTPAEFAVVLRERREAKQEEAEAGFYNFLNAGGLLLQGSKWRWQKPPRGDAAPNGPRTLDAHSTPADLDALQREIDALPDH